MYKKWFLTTIITLLAVLLLLCGTVFLVDPFFQYHEPFRGVNFAYTNAASQNPGIAKNFSYDTIITGSSMVQNFSPSLFDSLLGTQAVKLAYSGATLTNIRDISNLAFASKNNVTNAFIGLEVESFWNKIDVEGNQSPQYLMDQNYFNDVNYLLNKDVIIENTIVNLRSSGKALPPSRDSAFTWWGHSYGDVKVMQTMKYLGQETEQLPKDSFAEITNANLQQNVLPMIQDNPDTMFYIFFTPSSIMYWYEHITAGTAEALLETKYSIASELLMYDNVKLFDFQDVEGIVVNLYNYKDTWHYSKNINDYMVRAFATEKHMITKDNLNLRRDKMERLVFQYDYETYWHNELLSCTDFYHYMELINNNRYVSFFSVKDDATWEIAATQAVKASIDSFGLEKLTHEEHGYSYVAIKNGTQIVEQRENMPITYKAQVNGMEAIILSQGYEYGNSSSIKIDNIEYSQNSRGLNIVVYDKVLGRVVDSVCFDLCGGLGVERLGLKH